LELLPNLKAIATRSTGVDHIDSNYCKEKNIKILNVAEYGSDTVAEFTFGLILSLTRKIYNSVNQSKNFDFDHTRLTGVDLHGRTIGIIGLGKIGKNVLQIAKGFDMNAFVFNRSKDESLAKEMGFSYVELAELLKSSDIVTLHLPLTPETKHIINKRNILNFKKGSYLINTARGGLIETGAIMLGLEKGILEGVALDVLEDEEDLSEEAVVLSSEFRKNVNFETLLYEHVLINHPKVLITPHNAFNSREALWKITNTTIENIRSVT
jgi:D-lactate dehydrogenase